MTDLIEQLRAYGDAVEAHIVIDDTPSITQVSDLTAWSATRRPARTIRTNATRWLAVAASVAVVAGAGVWLATHDNGQAVRTNPPAGQTSVPVIPPHPSTSAVAPTPTSAVAPSGALAPRATTIHLVEAHSSDYTTVSLSLVETSTGKVIRKVWEGATLSIPGDPREALQDTEDPVLDAAVAEDGTVYLVERTAKNHVDATKAGFTRLVRIDQAGTVTDLKANVVDAELSPDGSKIAVSVLSPDGNGDGSGTTAIRVIDLASGKVDNLRAEDLSMHDDGTIDSEYEYGRIVAWTPDATGLIVNDSCCDSADISVVPTGQHAVGTRDSYPHVGGLADTYALGLAPDGKVLVQRTTEAREPGTNTTRNTGYEVVLLDPARPTATPKVVFTQPDAATGDPQEVHVAHFELVGSTIAGTTLANATDPTWNEAPYQGDPLEVFAAYR